MLRDILASGTAVMMIACTTNTFEWQRYTESDFPSSVHSLTTIVGNVIDADHQVAFGAWTIGFGKQRPYASYNCPQDSVCYIMVTDLKCAHSSAVNTACELKLRNDGACSLAIPKWQETFPIYCPLDVSLARRVKAP